MKFELYGFDLNGTLVDTFELDYTIDCSNITAMGGRAPTKEEFRNTITMMSWRDYYAHFGVADLEKITEMFYNHPARQATHVNVVPGVKQVLERLAVAKKPLFMVSINDHDSIRGFLAKAGLDQFFDESNFYGVDESKTSSIISAYTMRGVNPKDVVFVGDTIGDIVCAKEAGVVSVGLANDLYSYSPPALIRRRADYAISNMEELLEL